MNLPLVNWTDCQKEALTWLEDAKNVFLTGVAGSGKSFTIKHFLMGKNPKKFPVVASTGAAAILVGGRTFHSFFGLGIMEGGVDATVERAKKDRLLGWRLNRVEGVIIDEVSMLSGPTLRAAERIARMIREKNEPWGGLRIIAVGDFAQLPPVSRNSNVKEWAFDDPVWEATGFFPVVLRTICRTQDEHFIRVLNAVRNGTLNAEVEEFMAARRVKKLDGIVAPRLFPRRLQTEDYNLKKLQELSGKTFVFKTQYAGRENLIEGLKKNAPILPELHLKIGAFVMIRQNDVRGRWVNGSLGFVRKISEESLSVELLNGYTAELDKTMFSLLDAEGNIAAAATNFPVTLAWATTIHKSQGATMDAAVVNLTGLWEPGQAYVALSRVRDPASIYIEDWSQGSFRVAPEVVRFHQDIGF